MKGGGPTCWKIVWLLTLAPFAFQSVPFTVSGPPQTARSAPPSSCLQGDGPLVTVGGVKASQYRNTSLTDNIRIDASTTQILTADLKAITISGGSNICFYGGELLGQQPPSTAWSTMHGVTGIHVKTVKPFLHLENTRVFDSGDGVSMDPGGMNWTIRGVYFKYMRDDCVEDDSLYSGTIEDSLFDGCYDGISARTWRGQSPNPGDGSTNLIVMKNSLLRLQAMDAPYSGTPPNHNAFWKWDPKAPKVALYNNIFRADADSWEHGKSGMYLAPPPGKLADCADNTMVWLGSGRFPEPLPSTFNGKPCFTITTDKSVWDTAVAQWRANHPTTLSDVAAPIVSLFSPGIVGSTTLKGTVTLTATAVDDREVAGVQFKLDGQPIGAEVTSEAPLTKFTLTWDSHTKSNGKYTLTATARDAAGNTQTATGVTVTISN